MKRNAIKYGKPVVRTHRKSKPENGLRYHGYSIARARRKSKQIVSDLWKFMEK